MSSEFFDNRIAVVIPCYNEAAAIGDVVAGFQRVLPDAAIHVFDNLSTDDTAAIARAAGARVAVVPDRGKGNVVRRMFADVEADVYLMVDGDGTYDAATGPEMVRKVISEGLDMVVGCRVAAGSGSEYRFGHRAGNRLLTKTVRRIFGGDFSDMLSGYRAFSRRYVKSFPALSKGFEIETELTVHALNLRAPYGEIASPYGDRQEGSESKLATWGDGFRISKTILKLHMLERPRSFLLTLAAAAVLASLWLGLPVTYEYFQTGLVPRLPTAVLAASMMLSALLLAICAVILEAILTGRNETKRLVYLGIPGPGRRW